MLVKELNLVVLEVNLHLQEVDLVNSFQKRGSNQLPFFFFNALIFKITIFISTSLFTLLNYLSLTIFFLNAIIVKIILVSINIIIGIKPNQATLSKI